MVLLIKQNMMQQLMQLKMLPEKNDAAQLVRDEAKKGADIINLENQRILDEENYTTDYALQTERERIRYEAELAAANKSGADTTLITAKHALAKEKRRKPSSI
jgi:spore germination cell wall hydrolase CwlJ-like protein